MSEKKPIDLHVLAAEPNRLHTVSFPDDGQSPELGVLAPLRHGQPIAPGGRIVHVEPDPERRGVLRATEIADSPRVQELPPPARRTAKGPPKVTSDEYRTGWDGIFGKRAPTWVS